MLTLSHATPGMLFPMITTGTETELSISLSFSVATEAVTKIPFIFEELIKLQVKNSNIPSLSMLTRTSSHPCSPASLRNSCSTELSKWAKGDDVR